MDGDLITFITTDYAGITRGRSFPAADLRPGTGQSTGWVPANMSLTPFDLIADPNPWGSAGDLRLLGDEGARFRVDLPGAATPLDVMISDITDLGGVPPPADQPENARPRPPKGADHRQTPIYWGRR